MGVETGVKRKSKNKNETPNKLRKTDGVGNQKTPNKSNNTPVKNRQTPQKTNTNKSTKKQKTPPKRNKQNTEEEEEEEEEQSESKYEGNWKVEDDSDEENDSEDSDQKTPNKSPNTPANNRQTPKKNKNIREEDEEQSEKECEDEESDSDEENSEDSTSKVANVAEQGSDSEEDDNEKEEDEQKDSDEEVTKQPSPKKQTHLDRTKFTVYVNGLRGADFRVPDIFKDCSYTFYTMLKNHKTGKSTGTAFVNFDEEENYKKALEKNGTVINGVTITVLPKRTKEDENQTYNIFVGNLSRTSKIENIFSGCKIVTRKIFPHSKSALLYLEDGDSIQKALEKDQTEHDGNTITVQRKDCSVFVKGLTKSIKLEEFFSNCKIHNYKLHKQRDTGNFNGTASVHFADTQSYENALAKNGTEVEGKTISVEPIRPLENRNKNSNNMKKNEMKRSKPFVNKNTNKPFKKNTNKPFKKNANKPFKKNTNKPFHKKNNNKTFDKEK